MTFIKALCAVSATSIFAMAAFADDTTPPPGGGPREACKQDVHTLCPNLQPGGGRILACLKSHADQVSPGCKAAIAAARGRRGQSSSGSEPPSN